ncbi:MAG: dephospho-CoA kinase, partial [bacterium]
MGTPVIGVTGTIGTGKSTFCRFLAEKGGEHLDADTIAKDLMKPGHA